MELILNLLWAGLAIALLLLWRRFGPLEGRKGIVALLALVCVICILFPIVSMTDDLNASLADPETVKMAVVPHILAANGLWGMVYDPHATRFHHQVEIQADYLPPIHSYLSFLLTRRPPPPIG